MHFKNFEEFWPFYMNQHSKPLTRRWHYCGTGASTLIFILAIALEWRLLFFIPLVGYGLAWYSHFFIEMNKPAAFAYPIWSFGCDLKMFVLMLSGQMDREIKRLGERPMPQVTPPARPPATGHYALNSLLFSHVWRHFKLNMTK